MTINPPIVWLLASPHSGDNTQLFALAENLGWPFIVKKLSYNAWAPLSRFASDGTLATLTKEARAQIAPPYPDLILGAGQPTEAASLWIKKSANKPVKLVYLGTPFANLKNFDLVITTPQYGLPNLENVLHIDLPMHKVEPEKLRKAADVWRTKLNHLPRPWTAILVGGPSGPYTFNETAARRLAEQAQKQNGSLLISTSARTPQKTARALQRAITKPNYFHHWSSASTENPFYGFLALADHFIVTADSISMLSEACATGKSVAMFDTESESCAMRDRNPKINWRGRTLNTTLFRLAMRYAPTRWSRDLRIVHQQLLVSGKACWLGDKPTMPTTSLTPTALARATSRVKALFEI